MTQNNTKNLVFGISLIGFFSCIILSWKLWFPQANTFSPQPFFKAIGNIPEVIHWILSGLIFLILPMYMILKKNTLLIIYAGLILSLLFADQLRWQPWVYYYSFVFVSFISTPNQGKQNELISIRLILVFIYVWSGLQKFNFAFFFQAYPWLIEPLTQNFNQDFKALFDSAYLLPPIIETISGIGLLFKKSRRTCALILVAMHMFIILMIGPLGHNSNSVVWPWNISFAILLFLLFWNKDHDSLIKVISLKKSSLYQKVIILLFGIMPLFSFINLWPMFFSSALYSGNKVRSEVYIPDNFKEALPDYIFSKVNETDNATRLTFFVQEELNVPIYPSRVFHLKTFKKLCESNSDFSEELVLVTHSRPDILTGNTVDETFFCDEID